MVEIDLKMPIYQFDAVREHIYTYNLKYLAFVADGRTYRLYRMRYADSGTDRHTFL